VKVFLMYPDRDFDPDQKLPPNEGALIQDLELNTLFEAMALGDRFLFKTARQAIMSSLRDPDTIRYRQRILEDCLQNPSVVREIYGIPIESIERQRKHWMGVFSRYPSGILSSAVEMLEMFVVLLKKLRGIADGTRTFKLLEGEPLQTSYGQDLYHQIFGEAVATSGPPRPTS
jgi:hypothetical protein